MTLRFDAQPMKNVRIQNASQDTCSQTSYCHWKSRYRMLTALRCRGHCVSSIGKLTKTLRVQVTQKETQKKKSFLARSPRHFSNL
jgi:hypothetical protein